MGGTHATPDPLPLYVNPGPAPPLALPPGSVSSCTLRTVVGGVRYTAAASCKKATLDAGCPKETAGTIAGPICARAHVGARGNATMGGAGGMQRFFGWASWRAVRVLQARNLQKVTHSAVLEHWGWGVRPDPRARVLRHNAHPSAGGCKKRWPRQRHPMLTGHGAASRRGLSPAVGTVACRGEDARQGRQGAARAVPGNVKAPT